MSGPAFPVVGVIQQAVDQLVPGVGPRVGEEAVECGGIRWQAEQVDGQPACQHASGGSGRGGEAFGLQPRADEGVDWVAMCGDVGKGWRCALAERSQRPPRLIVCCGRLCGENKQGDRDQAAGHVFIMQGRRAGGQAGVESEKIALAGWRRLRRMTGSCCTDAVRLGKRPVRRSALAVRSEAGGTLF